MKNATAPTIAHMSCRSKKYHDEPYALNACTADAERIITSPTMLSTTTVPSSTTYAGGRGSGSRRALTAFARSTARSIADGNRIEIPSALIGAPSSSAVAYYERRTGGAKERFAASRRKMHDAHDSLADAHSCVHLAHERADFVGEVVAAFRVGAVGVERR